MKTTSWKFLLKRLSLFLTFIILIDLLLVTAYYNYATNWVDQHTTCNENYETGLVFFHSVHERTHELMPGSISRLQSAYQLYQNDKLNQFIVAGGNRKKRNYPNIDQPSGAKLMAEWLISKGVDANKVFIDSCSYDTVSNIENATRLQKQHNLGSLMCISSPLHLFRIQHLIQKSNIASGICAINSKKMGYQEIFFDVHQEWVAFFLMNWFNKKDYLHFIRSLRKVEVFECY